MSATVTVTDAKARLTELVAAVATTHDRFEITRNGEPAAVLVSHAEMEALLETIAVLSDSDIRRDLVEADGDIRSGNTIDATELRELMLQRHAASASGAKPSKNSPRQ